MLQQNPLTAAHKGYLVTDDPEIFERLLNDPKVSVDSLFSNYSVPKMYTRSELSLIRIIRSSRKETVEILLNRYNRKIDDLLLIKCCEGYTTYNDYDDTRIWPLVALLQSPWVDINSSVCSYIWFNDTKNP